MSYVISIGGYLVWAGILSIVFLEDRKLAKERLKDEEAKRARQQAA